MYEGRRRPPRESMRGSAALLILLLGAATARADNAVHGRLALEEFGSFARSYSLDAALGAPDHADSLANLRLTWEPSWDRVSLAFHYVVDGVYGDDARLERLRNGLLPSPPTTWFDLTNVFKDDGLARAEQSIDRLSVAYTAPDFVVRVGRQALTWGSGLVFRPMDLFDPFAPNATDTEYKPGTDMLYTQYLFADGSDLQAIAVPRPEQEGHGLTANASSFALHLQTTLFAHETTWLVARDYGDWVLAAGVNGPLAGATWNIELVPTFLRSGGTRVSMIANISDATTLADRNATLFAEYFHNGFGVVGDDTNLGTLPPDLIDRLVRGQLFNFRRDYLASGVTLEWSPLTTVSPTIIADLNDGSFYLLGSVTYSVSDNLNLIAGAQAPVGPKGSEFGGIRLLPASTLALAPASLLYIQVRRYF
jgi:hypothetical protein